MHKIGIAAFTQRGEEFAERLMQKLGAEFVFLRYQGHLKQWCSECFERADGIIFIGACGIAVRTIAPFLKSKTTDPAVLVIDEAGQFVISLLAGHIGGANELARTVASEIDAVPVITTASDVNGKIAVDVFAKKNDLMIESMQDAKKIASAILRGEKVGVYCNGRVEGALPQELLFLGEDHEQIDEQINKQQLKDNKALPDAAGCQDIQHLIWISEMMPASAQIFKYLNDHDGTVLHLISKSVILGIGCRKGKTQEEIQSIVDRVLREAEISADALCEVASIDLKKEEPGLLGFCRDRGLKFVTYSSEELRCAEGDFEASEFVKKTTGVDNVCERAAILAAGPGGKIVRKKYAENGVTVAIAVREWRVRFEE